MVDYKTCNNFIAKGSKLSAAGSPSFTDLTLYRCTVGALQYLTYTRTDIAFVVNKLSQYLQAPTINHWQACKRVSWFLKGTSTMGISFKPATLLSIDLYIEQIGQDA